RIVAEIDGSAGIEGCCRNRRIGDEACLEGPGCSAQSGGIAVTGYGRTAADERFGFLVHHSDGRRSTDARATSYGDGSDDLVELGPIVGGDPHRSAGMHITGPGGKRHVIRIVTDEGARL